MNMFKGINGIKMISTQPETAEKPPHGPGRMNSLMKLDSLPDCMNSLMKSIFSWNWGDIRQAMPCRSLLTGQRRYKFAALVTSTARESRSVMAFCQMFTVLLRSTRPILQNGFCSCRILIFAISLIRNFQSRCRHHAGKIIILPLVPSIILPRSMTACSVCGGNFCSRCRIPGCC